MCLHLFARDYYIQVYYDHCSQHRIKYSIKIIVGVYALLASYVCSHSSMKLLYYVVLLLQDYHRFCVKAKSNLSIYLFIRFQTVDNSDGKLCAHYPSHLILLERSSSIRDK